MLYFYNTLSHTKIPFAPLQSDNVRMYVCGPTVYDRIHLGNARSLVVFDVLYRILQKAYPRITYVRNITDVDDKINKKAFERNVPIHVVTQETIAFFHEDTQRLGILPPTYEPQATHFIPQMITLIAQYMKHGQAYFRDGHVLFRVDAVEGYGMLSGMQTCQMQTGARVESADYKDNPLDFVLWKPSNHTEPGWESPWGYGRPGWHIECSAMSAHYLGACFDIHGGGADLIFPHHENERAQTCAYFQEKECARFWMHNGLLTVEGQKMSKSLGNFIMLYTLFDTVPAEVIRYALLSTHYRQTLNWTQDLLEQAYKSISLMYRALLPYDHDHTTGLVEDKHPVLNALYDDLNTPAALTALHHMSTDVLHHPSAEKAHMLRQCARLLGLCTMPAHTWFCPTDKEWTHAYVEERIAERHRARSEKDFKKADNIRHNLAAKGIILEDTGDKTRWFYQPSLHVPSADMA